MPRAMDYMRWITVFFILAVCLVPGGPHAAADSTLAWFAADADSTSPAARIEPLPLPERFTLISRFSLDPKGADLVVWTAGLFAAPHDPSPVLALSLHVRGGGLFGPMADLKLTGSTDVLAPVTSAISSDLTLRSGILLGPDETYVATLSADRATGLVSFRFATGRGNVLAEGHLHLDQLPAPAYAGSGVFSADGRGGDWSVRFHELAVDDAHVRIGNPLPLERNPVVLRVVQPGDERNLFTVSEPVYVDSQLTAELIAPARGLPGTYRIEVLTDPYGGGRPDGSPQPEPREIWHGTLPPGQDRIRLTLSDLGTGRHEFVVHYLEPEYELELARGTLYVVAATVEAFLRYEGPGVQLEPSTEGPFRYRGELVLVADRDLQDVKIRLTARPAEQDAEPALVWQGTVSLQARVTRAIPITLEQAPPLEYEIAYDHPQQINFIQIARRIPMDHPFLIVREEDYAALRARLEDLAATRARSSGWSANVPVGDTLFAAILALDVVYYELGSDIRAAVVDRIDRLVRSLDPNGWTIGYYAVRGTWALFQGDRDTFERYKKAYRDELFTDHIFPDGVYSSAPGYALARFAGVDREQKNLFMDILEFTGEDTYYSEPRLQAFYEWLFAHGVTPDGLPYSFGDTSLNRPLDTRQPSTAMYRAYKFSETAGDYAAWWTRKLAPPGSLTAYVLLDRVPAPKQPAESKIYDNGAWFLDVQGEGTDWLAGALWNPTHHTGHAHKDVNAVHLAGYGRQLVVNSGYAGWGNGARGFSWEYIHDTAESSNTVLIDGADHRFKFGAGIRAGFITDRLAYATGHSGAALPNGTHMRSLLFIPSSDLSAGYWVLLDRVEPAGDASTVHVALHPRSARVTTVAPNREYEWEVGDVTLSVFLGTEPAAVELRDGVLAGFDGSLVGKYLYAEYPLPPAPTRSVVTVIFPYTRHVTKPQIDRVQGEGYTGVRIAQGGRLVDTVLESAGDAPVAAGEVTFQGIAAMFRQTDGQLDFYFIDQGTSLRFPGTDRGFAAETAVSLLLAGTAGTIDSPGARMTFYEPGIEGVLLNGKPARAAQSGPGWIQVFIPEGLHAVEFVTETPVSEGSD